MQRFLVILTPIGIALIGLGVVFSALAVISIGPSFGVFLVAWVSYAAGTILALTGASVGRLLYLWPFLTIGGIVYCMFIVSSFIWEVGSSEGLPILVVLLYLGPGLVNIIGGLIISQLKEKRKPTGPAIV